MVLLSAPDFSSVTLDEAHKNTIFIDLAWNTDGQEILYGVSNSTGILGTDYESTIWSINRDNTNPHLLFPDNPDKLFRGLAFWGWMDPRTLVYSAYAGGGHLNFEEYDFVTKKVLVSDTVHVTGEGPINSSYIPVTDCPLFCTTCVITRNVVSQPGAACRSMQGDAIQFPHNENYPMEIDTLFRDWQPGTNNILILAHGMIANAPVSRLLLWNVDTDKVTSIAPGGVSGKFSPDGKLLAYVTYGSSNIYDGINLQDITFDPVATDDQPYLQLMNVSSRQILLRVPLRTKVLPNMNIEDMSLWEITKPDLLSFSPDGRYMLFLTNGFPTLKNSHFPTDATINDPTKVFLNILDLQLGQLTQSLPMLGLGENTKLNLLWSPDSQKFVFRDGNKDWQLFELSNNTITPLTHTGGSQLNSPAWSYDGSYLSFSRYDIVTGNMKTFILGLGGLP